MWSRQDHEAVVTASPVARRRLGFFRRAQMSSAPPEAVKSPKQENGVSAATGPNAAGNAAPRHQSSSPPDVGDKIDTLGQTDSQTVTPDGTERMPVGRWPRLSGAAGIVDPVLADMTRNYVLCDLKVGDRVYVCVTKGDGIERMVSVCGIHSLPIHLILKSAPELQCRNVVCPR